LIHAVRQSPDETSPARAQGELQTARERARRKAAIVAHQEQALAGDAAARERRALGADLAHARAAVEQLRVRARSRPVPCVMGGARTRPAQRPGAATWRPTGHHAG